MRKDKDIVLIANYGPTPGTKSNDRMVTIIDLLVEQGYNVELISTTFQHSTKKQKQIAEEVIEQLPYKYTMVYESGYPKNVSLKRVYSHSIAAKNLSKYLNERKKPDLIFVVTTSTAFAYAATKYAKENDIKLVIDVQDLWPEAFKMVVKNDFLYNLIFHRQKKKANTIYAAADGIIGVSQTYVKRALSVNNHAKHSTSVFLGTQLNKFDSFVDIDKSIKLKTKEEFWVAYIGTLGHSYNLNDIIDAFEILKNKGLTKIKFKVLGDGPLKETFVSRAASKDIECEFLGRLPYPEMVKYLTNCDMAVNPIIDQSAASIINKVGDYAAAKLPVINTQPDKEYRQLVEKYEIGFNCNNGDIEGIAEKIEFLYNNKDIREKMGENNRQLAQQKFDRNKTYKQIIDMIDSLVL